MKWFKSIDGRGKGDGIAGGSKGMKWVTCLGLAAAILIFVGFPFYYLHYEEIVERDYDSFNKRFPAKSLPYFFSRSLEDEIVKKENGKLNGRWDEACESREWVRQYFHDRGADYVYSMDSTHVWPKDKFSWDIGTWDFWVVVRYDLHGGKAAYCIPGPGNTTMTYSQVMEDFGATTSYKALYIFAFFWMASFLILALRAYFEITLHPPRFLLSRPSAGLRSRHLPVLMSEVGLWRKMKIGAVLTILSMAVLVELRFAGPIYEQIKYWQCIYSRSRVDKTIRRFNKYGNDNTDAEEVLRDFDHLKKEYAGNCLAANEKNCSRFSILKGVCLVWRCRFPDSTDDFGKPVGCIFYSDRVTGEVKCRLHPD
jgi:hypothetical protein